MDNGFKPLYVISPEKQQVVSRLKQAVRQASEVYVATDEDREGESIAWHLIEVLSPDVPVKRMVFHEITRPAIQLAVENWRDLDRRMVDAQEARRILDRLYGYEVSPVLWKKVMPRLSAGRRPERCDEDDRRPRASPDAFQGRWLVGRRRHLPPGGGRFRFPGCGRCFSDRFEDLQGDARSCGRHSSRGRS